MSADQVIEAVEKQHNRILGYELPPDFGEFSPDGRFDTLTLIFLRERIDLDFYFSSLRRLPSDGGASGWFK